MKYVRNMVLLVALSIFMVNMIPINSFAAGTRIEEIRTTVINYSWGGFDMQTTQIVTKFRWFNGKLQYRRWNKTTGQWIDPYWIDA